MPTATRSPSSAPTTALPRPLRVPAALAALAVLLQVAYPLVSGAARDRLTVVSVLVLCAASVGHAAQTRGPRWAAALLLLSAGTGLLAEAVGVRTGLPFGRYSYDGSLGPRLLGVPLVVPLAWTMLAYPALLAGRLLGRPVLAGAWALASWDLFLDPQMVAAGHWRWESVRHALPGVPGIPVSNLVGWLAVSLLLMGLLSRLPVAPADDRLPLGLYLWTYGSSVLANLLFFGRPGVALVGGLAMGLVAVPLARRLLRPPG